ncbi:MAG TPA: hypothetical protein VF125_02295 [Solirubrobacterales bacterium]
MFEKAFRWLGENFAAGIVGAFAALAVSAAIAFLLADKASEGDQVTAATKRPRAQRSFIHADSWPDRVSAWTVVLASEATRGLAEAAVEKAKRVPSRGLNIGILHSDDYVSLRPGFWVAFAGQYDSVDEAQQAAERYRGQFPSTYQRFIEQR